MFERFTDRARRVIVLAQEEARMLNHNYIGTEHVLLGLIHEHEGVAGKALTAMGISLEGVRTEVETIVGMGQQAPSGHIPFTPRGKKVMELALREALHLGHNYIGTEHLLLGLLREGEGVAAQVLVRKIGSDALHRVRQQVIKLVGEALKSEPVFKKPNSAQEFVGEKGPEYISKAQALIEQANDNLKDTSFAVTPCSQHLKRILQSVVDAYQE